MAEIIDADELPWLIDVNVFMTAHETTSWSRDNQVNASAIRNGYDWNNGNNPSSRGWYVNLAAGTWSFEALYTSGTNRGILTVQIDGSTVGTIDTYAGSTTFNNRTTISSIAVASSGKHTLTVLVNSKNASSTNFFMSLQHIQLRRTA